MDDLFEADDTLPDRDELSGAGSQVVLPGVCEQYFDVLGGVAVPKSSVLRDILRAAAQSARASAPVGIARGTAANASPEKIVPGAPLRLADIDPQRLARLLRIIERGIRTAESVEVLPPAAAAATSAAPAKKPSKAKSAAAARRAAQRASTSASRSRSRSPRKSGEPEDEDGRESDVDKSDVEKEEQAAEQAASKASPGDDGLNTPPLEENPDVQQLSLSVRMNLVTYSVLAAECCLAILSGEDLPKHLISEDLIRPCVESIKLALDRVILPFVEACGGAMGVHPLLERLVQDLAPVTKRGRGRPSAAKAKAVQREEDARRSQGTRACSDALARMFRETGDALRQVQRLVNLRSVTLSEAIVISAVYAAVQPFFVNEPDPGGASEGKTDAAKAAARGRIAISALGGGTAAMKSLRLPCLNLLRSIFARHADLRNWIIEEILTNLIKLPDMKKNRRQYSLRTGRHIHSVTALLLQLVQASSDGAAVARAGAVYGTADAAGETQRDVADGDAEDESSFELAGWARSLEGPKVASRDIASYLMQR
jgi:cohesin loading factor subunit SCC2